MKILSKCVCSLARPSPPSPAGPTYTSMATMNRVMAAMTQAVTNM